MGMNGDTSKLSRWARGASTMEEGENNLPQKWACSSLSSSEKFSSLYEKVHEDSLGWDQKNIDSLVTRQNLQQPTVHPAVPKPRCKIIFPHIMTRGSVVGNKVYCKTSINNCLTLKRRSNSLCDSSSMLLMNFYHERSSDIQSGIAKNAEEMPSSDLEDHETMEHRPVSKRFRTVLLRSVAGAAGMQLLFPSLRLPLIEVLLFSHRWPSRRRSPLFSRGVGGWWRFPLNLAVAISRPFYGSVLRRSLTAMLFLLQLRVRKKNEQRSARYMPHLYTLPFLEKRISFDRDTNLSSGSFANTTDTEVETPLWESHSATYSEDGENSVHVEDLIKLESDCLDDVQSALDVSQDVTSDDGLSSSSEFFEQDVISDDGFSSSGDSSDQDVISEEGISSISNSSLKELDVNNFSVGHLPDGSHREASGESISRPYGTAFSQPYDDSPLESPTETCSSVFTSETCSTSDISTRSYAGSSLGENSKESTSTSDVSTCSYSGVSLGENSEESSSTSDISTSSLDSDSDTVVTMEEESDEEHFTLNTSTSLVLSDTDSAATREAAAEENDSSSDISAYPTERDPDSIVTTDQDAEETHSTLDISNSWDGNDPDSIVSTEEAVIETHFTFDTISEDRLEIHSTLHTSTSSVGTNPDSFVATEEDFEQIHSNLDIYGSLAGIDRDSLVRSEEDSEHSYTILNITASSEGSDPVSFISPVEDLDETVEGQCLLLQQNREVIADTLCADVADEEQIPTPLMGASESCVYRQHQPTIVEDAVENSVDDEVLFPSSEEFQFHDDIPPSPCETSRQKFVRSSSETIYDSLVRDTESTPGSARSMQMMSPRADLTALMPEDLITGPADGTWEIKVDRLEVVWTPFKKNRPVLVSEGEDSSDFSNESTADDTDSCKSADGSQMGREDELSDEDRIIVQNADRRGEDCQPSDSVQDRKFDHHCVEVGRNENFSIDFSSGNRFPGVDLESRLEDAREEHDECIPATRRKTSDDKDARDDFEFQYVSALRESEAANAEVLSACDAEGNKVMEAATTRVQLNVRRDGEELFGTETVIPEDSDRSSGTSTETSFTRRQDISHDRDSRVGEVLHSEDDCCLDVVKGATSKNLSSLTVVDSTRHEFDRVRVPTVAHIDEGVTIESRLRKSESLPYSVSSSSFITAFSDDVDTSLDGSSGSASGTTDTSSESSDASTGSSFADHPACIHLRKVRHSHGDQKYLDLPELLSEPWRNLVYWHGRCREGRPTLVVLLGKAVRQLSASDLKHFITVTISHAEYAELNFFEGAVKQLNILMDLDGLGLMRLPPMHVLQSIGTLLNRDYAGRGGWIFLVNAPMMLGLVISAVQRVIIRPSYTKGAMIDKGFLEGKERIMTLGGRYKATLLNHFEEEMLPSTLGGTCAACSNSIKQCCLGFGYLSQ